MGPFIIFDPVHFLWFFEISVNKIVGPTFQWMSLLGLY